MDLLSFLKTLSDSELEDFADSCETTVGHLRNVAYGTRRCRESLAISIERESIKISKARGNGDFVPCEKNRPDVDWAFLRGTSTKSPLGSTTRKRA